MGRHVGAVAGALLALVVGGAGCATIIKGSSTDVRVETTPPGAMLYLDGQPIGPSPRTVTVKQDEHTLSAASPGMQGFAQITTGFSGWSILGSPVGMIIDAITGAITTVDQSNVNIVLVPEAAVAPPGWGPPPTPPPVGSPYPAPTTIPPPR